jgi:hypothetical protein
MRDTGMVRILAELILEHCRSLEIGPVGLIGLRLRSGDVERRENLRLVVGRIFLRQRLVGLGARNLPVPLRARGEILVVRRDRVDVIALAIRLEADAARFVERLLRHFGALRRRACPASGLDIWMAAIPQYAIEQVGSSFRTILNACSPAEYQNECSIATARSNCACTLGLQLVGKETLPSGPDCESVSWAWAAGRIAAAKTNGRNTQTKGHGRRSSEKLKR